MASSDRPLRGEAAPRTTSRLANVALALATLVFLCAIGEVILRVFFPIAYSMDIQYVLDPHLGLRLEPDQRYTLEAGGVCTINNLGFRHPRDLAVDKPDGVVRVVVLGGSSAFCYEVDDADTWCTLLETRLQARYGAGVEVINAGVPGYDEAVSLVNYIYRVWALDPDVVVVYHTWNGLKLLHVVEAGGLLEKEAFAAPSRVRKFLRHFQLAWRVRSVYWKLFRGDQRENMYDPAGYVAIAPGGRAHRWVRHNFDELAAVLKSDGVIPVFCSEAGLLSRDNVGDEAVRAAVRNDYANLTVDETLNQWLAMTTIIEQSASDNGALFVDVYGQVPHVRECFHDHVHLTEEGNRRVADAVYGGMVGDSTVDAALRGDARWSR